MHKHFKTFQELHHTHKVTHRLICLVIFSILVILFFMGLQKVKASLANYVLVPNGPKNVCYKIHTDYKDVNNHVSCITHEKVCQTAYGVLVGCQTKRAIDLN